MNAHAYAIEIEHILRKVFDCDRGGFAGLIDADSIEHNLYVPIACGLGYLYAKAGSSKQTEIEKFINDYDYYLDFGINGLLLFTSNEREVNGGSYSINYDNGEKALEAIIESLSNVCK